MASAYDRIKASRRKFHESAGLTDQDIANFQQNYVASQDGAQLVADLKTAEQNLINSPATVRDQHKALADYASAMDRVSTFVGLGGQAPGADSAYLQRMQEQYAQAWNNYDSLVKANRQGFGSLGMQTAAGIAPNGTQFDREPLSQHLKPGRGLIDFNTGYPTESNQRAAQENAMRTQYQNIQTEAGQEAARWGQQAAAAQTDKERADYWLNIVSGLPVTNDARIKTSNDEWMRQAAQDLGIDSYIDRDDLLRKIRVKSTAAGASGTVATRRAEDYAGQQRAARAYEYQLDNPNESIEANYYLALRDQAARDIQNVDSFADYFDTKGAVGDWLRYNSAYGDQLYQDQKNEEILAIRSDPNVGPVYQEAMEASRNANEAERLLNQANTEIHDYSGIGAKTEMEIRELANRYGITVGQGDGAMIAALEQILQEQTHTVNTNTARLQAQGYDPKRIGQYIEQALNEQRADEESAAARQYADEKPGEASIGTSFYNLLSGGAYVASTPRAIGNAIAGITGNYDNYVPIDTNSEQFAMTRYVMDVRDEVTKNIQENGGTGFLYGVGMSMLDNVVQMAVGAALMGGAGAVTGQGARAAIQSGMQSAATASLATMGLSAASQELVRLTEQGVSSDQAFALATVKGAVEIVTEKIGIDNFVSNLGKKSTGNFVQQIVGMAAQQSAAEGGEEIIAEVAGLYADWLILQEESDIAKTIEAGRLNGMTESEALWDAFEKYALQVLEAGAAGAVSGLGFGAMSTAGMVVDAVSPAATGARIRAEGNEPVLGMMASAYGLEYDESMTDRQIGKVYREVQKQADRVTKDMQYGISMESYAQEKGYDTKTAKALSRSWNAYRTVDGNNMSSREFAATWNSVKAAGQANMSFDNAVAELGETTLSRYTLESAWKAGQRLYAQAHKTAKAQPVKAQETVQQENVLEVKLGTEIGEGVPAQTELVQRTSEKAATYAQQLMGERINVNGLSDDVVESFYGEIDSDIATERQGALAMARMLTGVSKNISQVIFVDSASYDAEGRARPMSNGMWDPTNRTMTIDINAGRQNLEQQMTFMTRAMSHEITHSIKTTAREQYDELSRFVLREMDKQHNLEALIEAKIKDYASAGVKLDREGAIDELVAEACEQMLERTYVLKRLARENRSLWEKIRDFFKAAIEKLRNLYKGLSPNSTEAKLMQGVINELQAKWDAAFAASLTAEVTETSAAAQHSIAGRNAAIADIVSMENAVRMEEAGHTAPEIYNDTGWFRGADNMWRFEIDDSTMRYTPERMAQKMTDGAAHLEDVIDHPVLFEAYPQLRDVSVTFSPMKPGSWGVYRRRENRIYLADSIKNSPEATLIHEIQHAIQAMEGFAFGASRAYWKNIIDNVGKIDSKRLRDATAAVRKFEGSQGNKEIVDARNRLNSAWEEGAKAGAAMYAQLETEGIAEKVDAYEDMLWEQSNAGVAFLNSTPMELYQNTAGEQEARDVAERRTMTSEQRKGKMPQTGTKDTVFAEGSSASASDSAMKPSKEIQFSANMPVDSDGNPISEVQQVFFEHSEVRDGKGRLMPMYHATRANFTAFDREKIGSSGAGHYLGYGFNFAASELTASQYGGNIMKLYLNVQDPLSDTEKTLTTGHIEMLIRNVDMRNPDFEDDVSYSSAWDYSSSGYNISPRDSESVVKTKYAKAVKDAARSIYEYAESDADIYSQISQSAASADAVIDTFKSIRRDGVLWHDEDGRIRYVITFDPNQAKNVTNTNPTDSDDIRYQISRDTASNMDLLMGASMDGLSKAEADHLLRYRDRVNEIRQNQRKIDELKAEELTADINAQIKLLENANSIIYRKVSSAEKTKLMQGIIERERAAGDVELERIENRIADLEEEIDELERAKIAGRMHQVEIDAKTYIKREKQLIESKRRALERAKASRDKKISEMKESRAKSIESRRMTQLRHKVRYVANDLRQRMLHPTDGKYVPNYLAKAVIEVASMIDDPPGERAKAKARAKYADMQAALRNLRYEYDNLEKDKDPDYNSEYDREFAILIDELANAIGDTAVKDMTYEQIEDVYSILRDIRYTLIDAVHQIGSLDRRTNYDTGVSIIEEMQAVAPRKKVLGDIKTKMDGLAMSPLRNVHKMTGYQEDSTLMALFDDLNTGIRRQNKFVMEANQMFDPLREGKLQNTFAAACNDVVDFELLDIDGKPVKMTRMDAMQIVLSFERERANEDLIHMEANPVNIADPVLMRKGKVREAISQGQMVSIGLEQIKMIESKLTEWDKQFMEKARELFNGKAKDAINETSRLLKHRNLATGKAYIPFHVDQNFVDREIEGVKVDSTIEGAGSLKSLSKKATQPLIITGLNHVIDDHIGFVGKYYGLAVPIRNFNKAYNIKKVGSTLSVKSAIDNVWGRTGLDVIASAVRDLQKSRERATDALSKGLQALQSGFVKAALLSNVSVTIKQASSYYSAGLHLSPLALARYQAAVPRLFAAPNGSYAKNLYAEIDEHTAQHWIRRQGMSTQELGENAQRKGKLADFERKLPASLNPVKWIQNMDVATTGALWLACKKEIQNSGNYELNSEEYWDAVTELYDRTIEETQGMYDVLHRPEVQKTTNELVRQLIMFRTEPLQHSGLIYDSFGELAAAKKSGDEAWRKRAVLKARRAVGSQLVSMTVFAAMTMIAGIVTHRLDRYRDEDEELTFLSVLFTMLGDLGQDAMGKLIPVGGSELYDVIVNKLIGSSRFETVSVPVVGVINDYVDALTTVRKAFEEQFEADEPDWKAAWATVYELGKETAELFGIPVTNVQNILVGTYKNAVDIANGYFPAFNNNVERADGVNYRRLYQALESGDDDKFDEVYSDLMQSLTDGGDENAERTIASGLQQEIREAYLDGDLTYEDATRLLTGYTIVLSDTVEQQHNTGTISDEEYLKMLEDEAYWTIKGWDTNAVDSDASTAKYADLQAVIEAGGDGTAAIEELLEHGETEKEIRSGASGIIADLYKNGEIDADTAEEYLAEYAGITDSKDLYTWFTEKDHWVETGENDYGAYGPVWDALMDGGDVNGAINTMVKAGWTEKEVQGEVREHVKIWVLGTSDDGYTISTTEAQNILSKYGGVSDDDMVDYLNAYEFWLEDPGRIEMYDFHQAVAYAEHGEGIDEDVFFGVREAYANSTGIPDGKGGVVDGSKKAEVMAYIDELPITDAQKDQLYLMYWKESRIYEAPWH